jgi:predicted nucleic acid-binding Zn ribbon protein
MVTAPVDIQGCENCSNEFPIETMRMTDDGCWICSGCDSEFRQHFSSCGHQWESHVNSHGEPSQYCPKCSGTVRNEDMALLGPKS